ncbi:MAG: AAA family ATPase [Lachnospiraceae bacterium]|nr:AAA family ATPase [Lachnospiraceae bacterium]
MNTFHITKAEKHVRIVNGEGHRERAEYLTIHTGLTEKALREDIAKGADFLKELPDALERAREERIFFIHAGSEEEGLMAVTWLESIFSSTEYEEDGFPEEDLPGDWENTAADMAEEEILADGAAADKSDEKETAEYDFMDDPEQVLLIDSMEINRYLMQEAEMGGMFGGGFAGRYSEAQEQRKPYWTECHENPVCICQGKFGDSLVRDEKIDLFSENPRIYIMNEDPSLKEAERGEVVEDEDEEDPFPFGLGAGDTDEYIKRSLVNTGAEYIKVVMDEAAEQQFFSAVLKGKVKALGYRLQKGMDLGKLVGRLLQLGMGENMRVAFVERSVTYIAKRKKNGKTLSEEDFSILFSVNQQELKKKADAWKRLDDELVGLADVKKRVRSIVNNLKFERMRREKGLKGIGYHNVFMMLGAPGTAKTTVAQLIGDIMREERLLKGSRFVSVNGAELKGKYVGWTTEKVKDLFKRNDIIFIDEAYSLVSQNGDSDSFSQEAVAQLCIELEAHAMDRLVIFAGYGGESMKDKGNLMKHFLRSNPGITSRINATIFFPSYSPEEMTQIFHIQARSKGLDTEHGADAQIGEYFAWRKKAEDFGNGREARSLLESGITKMADRLAGKKKYTRKDLSLMTEADIRAALEEKRFVSGKLEEKETRRPGFI